MRMRVRYRLLSAIGSAKPLVLTALIICVVLHLVLPDIEDHTFDGRGEVIRAASIRRHITKRQEEEILPATVQEENKLTDKHRSSPESKEDGGQVLYVLTPRPAPTVLHEDPEDSNVTDNCAQGNLHDPQNGAFCIDKKWPMRHALATSLCAAMEKLLQGKDIVDFGTGYGYLGRCMLRMNVTILPPPWDIKMEQRDFLWKMTRGNMWDTPKLIKSWRGYDAARNIQEFTSGFIQYFDLTKPRYLGRTFDWVTCLEVAEHIPLEFENVLLENLIRHAREGIIMSWATPCKHCPFRIGHVNERPNWYVEQKMGLYGFAWDEGMRRVLADSSAASRRDSIMAFTRVK